MKSDFKTILPENVATGTFHQMMLSVVAPRPIAFVTTVSDDGKVNLSPFSFFNAFGSKPPILIFSPARRVRDNTLKHTLHNAMATKQCTISVVNYAMVMQMSLSSCEYPNGVDEYMKAGFTPMASGIVTPPFVAEAPAAFECEVLQVIETGQEGGAGNLVICKILAAHFKQEYVDQNNKIDSLSLDLVARMGADWYLRATPSSMFTIIKPNLQLGIGFDALPNWVKDSEVLSPNDLASLANHESIPSSEDIKSYLDGLNTNVMMLIHYHKTAFELLIKQEIKNGNIELALLMAFSTN